MSKPQNKPLTNSEQLQRQAVAIREKIAATNAKLRRALVEGGDTRALRSQLVELDLELATIEDSYRALEEQRAAEQQAALGRRAASLVDQARQRLAARLNALQPPPFPIPAAPAVESAPRLCRGA